MIHFSCFGRCGTVLNKVFVRLLAVAVTDLGTNQKCARTVVDDDDVFVIVEVVLPEATL